MSKKGINKNKMNQLSMIKSNLKDWSKNPQQIDDEKSHFDADSVSEYLFKIRKRKSYTKWDSFCIEALQNAKRQIGTNPRYSEASGVISLVVQFVETMGWEAFVALVATFALGTFALGTMAVGGLFTGAVSGPLGWAMLGGSLAGAAIGYKLYSKKELTIKVKNILAIYWPNYKQLQPYFSHPQKERIHVLFTRCIIQIIEDLYDCEILSDDTSLPFKPVCLCGTELVPAAASKCYENQYQFVICDICDQRVANKKDVFHCPNNQTNQHSRGYETCARQNSFKFKRYHALIIQPLSENVREKVKDARELKTFFEKMNYHSIKVLKENNATPLKIKNELRKMGRNNVSNDVIVICYSGHGEKNNRSDGGWLFWLNNGQTITDREFIQSIITLDDVKYGQRALTNGTTCDIVILLNACFSGRFQVPNDLQSSTHTSDSDANEQKQQIDLDLSGIDMRLLTEYTKYAQELSDNDRREIERKYGAIASNFSRRLAKKYEQLSRSVVIISACGRDEEATANPDNVSTFWKFVMEDFENRTEKRDVTPLTVYENIERRSHDISDGQPLALNTLQNAQRAYNKGDFAWNVPLYPVCSSYE